MSLKNNLVFLIVIFLLYLFFSNINVYNISKIKKKECDCEKIDYCFYKNIINIEKMDKPKIFIHIDDEQNIPGIILLCIESVLKYCSNDYDIILYENDDISKLINDPEDPLCNIKNINLLSGRDLKQWEEYCKFKIIKKYGGVAMKPYFLFSSQPPCKEFKPESLKICRVNNEGLSVSNENIIPTSCYMIAAPKNDNIVGLYVKYLDTLCRNNYTSDIKHFNKSFEKLHHLDYFSEELIGIVDSKKNIIHLEQILKSVPLTLSANNFCLFINVDLLKKKRHSGWIVNMSKEQILETNTVISKYSKL